MEITVLTENTVSRRGLLAEHGLSVLVEEGGKRILFDTGQSGVYIHNAEQLGISLEGLDATGIMIIREACRNFQARSAVRSI